MFVYDINDLNSFEYLESRILEIEKNTGKEFCKILVGTKCDLEDSRKVSYDQAKEFSDKIGIKFFETSAKTNINVDEAFLTLIKEVLVKKGFDEKNVIELDKMGIQEGKNIQSKGCYK